jgi:hypothetical protein
MTHESSDGISYLMALKQSSTGSTRSGVMPSSGINGAEKQDFKSVEKRRSPRYKCEGSAELRQEGASVHTWATFTDVSMHGCYVEATSTYPVETVLDMKLNANGFEIQTRGKVRMSYPFLGMGIAFTEVPEPGSTHLKELLRTLSRPSVIMGTGSSSFSSALRFESVPLISNPTAAIQAIIEFFDKRQMLMRDEFLAILHRSQIQTVP